MSWRDRIVDTAAPEKEQPKAKSSWRDRIETIPEEPAPDVSKVDSFARGALDSASMGWLDELAGHLEAVGSKIGIRGLGGNSLSDIRFETDEEDKQSYDEIYESARDAKRKISKQAREANPNTYMAGEFAGGAASGLAAGGFLAANAKASGLARNATTLGQRMAAGAAGSAVDAGVTGAGYSEGKNPGDVLKDAATSAAIGGVFGGVMPAVSAGISKVAPAVTKKFNKAVLDLDEDVSDMLTRNPKYLDDVKDAHTIRREVVDATNNLSKTLGEWDDEAWATLSKETFPPQKQAAIKIELTDRIRKELQDQGHVRIGVDGMPFAVGTPQSARAIKRAEEIIDVVQKSDLSPSELKRILKTVDAEINWDKQELEATNKLLRNVRHEIDDSLKSRNAPYRDIMEELADGTSTLDNIKKDLRIKRDVGGEWVPTDTTEKKLKTALRGTKNNTDDVLRGNLDKLSVYERGPDAPSFTDDLQKLDLYNRSRGGVTTGSKGVNFGMGIGGGLLGLVFGTVAGGGIGLIAGAAAGAARDKFGRSAGTALSKLVGQMRTNYGKYFTDAIAKGAGRTAASNHYLLYNRDPDYKELYDAIQQELENGSFEGE